MMQKKILFMCFLFFVSLISVSCEKKKPLDPLSYLSITAKLEKDAKIEKTRTQIVSLTQHGNNFTLVLGLAQDSPAPKKISTLATNAYAIRFTLLSSFTRSKEFGGGTFVLKLKDVGNKNYIVRNFTKSNPYMVRFPSYSVNEMDSIVNPQIVNVYNPTTNKCVLLGCNGTLSPSNNNKRIYFVALEFANSAGEEWEVDHGFLSDAPNGQEPDKIINKTAQGIKIDFAGKEVKLSKPTYNSSTLGK